MPEPSEIVEQLRAARAGHDESSRRVQEAQIRHISLLREKQRLERTGDRERLQAIEGALQRSSEEVARFSGAQREGRAAVAGLVAGLHELLTPERLTTLWSADTPILLLPLRVETRFKGSELLVRVFPDEIAIDTHEEIPTVAEAAAGHEYWTALASNSDETSRKEAWRKLVDAFTAPRAAYVVMRTKPTA